MPTFISQSESENNFDFVQKTQFIWAFILKDFLVKTAQILSKICIKIKKDMKLLLLTSDSEIKEIILDDSINSEFQVSIFEKNEPLEVLSYVCDLRPTLLILDDDFIQPHSARIIKSIKNFCKNISIIFITSDSGIDLGREISQLGIQYYTFKPVSKEEIIESVNSIIKAKSIQ